MFLLFVLSFGGGGGSGGEMVVLRLTMSVLTRIPDFLSTTVGKVRVMNSITTSEFF